jgi:hypothetical protein
VLRLRLILVAAFAAALLVSAPALVRAHAAHQHARAVASSAWD